MKRFSVLLISFLLGALTLCLMSFYQKFLAGYPFKLKGFVIPFLYGGLVGSIIGWAFMKCCEHKRQFDLMFRYSTDWEYWQDEQGGFMINSPACEDITGYTPEEFRKNPFLLQKIVLSEDWDKWKSHIHEVRNGEMMPVEFRIRTKNGDIRWIYHNCRVIFDDNGKKLGMRGSNRDITTLKEMCSEVDMLRGFLPICSSCKKIRDDRGYWNQVETYIALHSDAEFTHSICPDCMSKFDFLKGRAEIKGTPA